MDLPPDLLELRRTLEVFDPVDLAAGVGALQLMPENADRSYRLQLAASVVGTLPPLVGKRPARHKEWARFLNGAQLASGYYASQEDPFNDLFTDSIIFHGGTYVVFPGFLEEAVFTFQALADALSLPKREALRPLSAEASSLIMGALALSDEIAHRSGLKRGLTPHSRPRRQVVIPFAGRFDFLKGAVSFSRHEMDEVLRNRDVPPGEIDIMATPFGTPKFASREHFSEPHLERPILSSDDGFVVVSPGTILPYTSHRIVSRAVELGLAGELATAYRDALARRAYWALTFLGCQPLPDLAPNLGEAEFKGGFFSLDRDKVAHVLLVSDPLRDYSPEEAYGAWTDDTLSARIEEHLARVEEEVMLGGRAPNDLIHIVLVQGLMRSVVVGLGTPSSPLCAPYVAMGVDDLEVICHLEGGQQLALWHYARASDKIRDTTKIIVFSQLDEYQLFRSRHYSYCFEDSQPPSFMSISPGGAGLLKAEAQSKFDIHGVLCHDRVIDVALLYGDASLPVYGPFTQSPKDPAILLELEAGKVWIEVPETSPEPGYRQIRFLMADTVCYWLWQAREYISDVLGALLRQGEPVYITIEVESDPAWFEVNSSIHTEVTFDCSVCGPRNVLIKLPPQTARLFRGKDNSGERALLAATLEILSRLSTASTDQSGAHVVAERIARVVDLVAPIGLKKKLILLDAGFEPPLVEGDLPRYRPIQPFNEEELKDELGVFLLRDLAVPVGEVRTERVVPTLNSCVEFLARLLETTVRSLSPTGLLEGLVALNERVVHEQANFRLTTPTRIACFSENKEILADLQEHDTDLNRSAIVSRFIIEYVTAVQPRGLRPFSLSVFDRLMAIGALIFDYATASDMTHHDIAHVRLTMQPSGRLRLDWGKFASAREGFLKTLTSVSVERHTEEFPHHWRVYEPPAQKPREILELDVATEAEFGLCMTDLLSFLAQCSALFDPREALKAVEFTELTRAMGERLGWTEENVQRALSHFSTLPRPDFWNPPPPHTPRDVHPWRYNRSLSYMRKPLLVRLTKDGNREVVCGPRMLYMAGHYLLGLCTSGKMRARSPVMKAFMGRQRQQSGEDFNNRVAALFEQDTALTVRKRVKKLAALKITRSNGELLGDIDVLVGDPRNRELLAIETKRLSTAIAAPDLANELAAHFGKGETGTTVRLHQERVRWLEAHLGEVVALLGLPAGKGSKWKLRPLIVVDEAVFGPHIVRCPIPVIPYRELARQRRAD